MNRNKNLRGFAALVSVLIISAILTVITFEASTASYLARADLFDAENKTQSSAAARACVQAALLKLAQNSAYQPAPAGDTVSIENGQSCVIAGAAASGNDILVTTRASTHGAQTRLTVTVHPRQASEALKPAVPAFSITGVVEN
jgi:Tfp pilus assembly protein PilV